MHKRGIQKQDDSSYKHRKTVTNLHSVGAEKENKANINDNDEPLMIGSDYAIKKEIKREENNGKGEVTNKAEVESDVVCKHCREHAWVWLENKGILEGYDENEHGNLPDQDKPPNNIHRKKVYRQMLLSINQGPAGPGVRIELPKCVEEGARQMFPSPSFMGFKSM